MVAVADPANELTHYGYAGELIGGRDALKPYIAKFYVDREDGAKAAKDYKAYDDYRELLEKEDVDALYISTPDHWHAKICLDGVAKGKHMYVQKPLALTLKQGRMMSDAVAKAGVTWQTGSQQRSDIYFRTACEFVRNGRLGELTGIKLKLPGGHKDWSKLGSIKETRPR